MPRAIVTVRVTQEQFIEIDRLVDDGLFDNRSHVLQMFVKLGLEYCDLSLDENAQKVSAEFKTRAMVAIQETSVHSLCKSIITELSSFIELKQEHSIIDSLANIEDLSIQLSSDTYQKLMEVLATEPVYQVAQRMTEGE